MTAPATSSNPPAERDPARRPRSASDPDGGPLAGKRLARTGGWAATGSLPANSCKKCTGSI
ncbi:MAG: hypothetical protein FD144_1716 [Rhodospirillaceae bacterium]|nr:MAG: hypothetical protein FD144_1716 [Rhodospirillaceae bacterium]